MCEIDYQYLRPKKAAALKAWHDAPFAERETLDVWCGEGATILPQRGTDDWNWSGRGGVVDASGAPVELSATRPIVEPGYPFQDPAYRDEKVVYCGYLIQHWGHFLVEGVARLWYFLEKDPTIDKYVFVLKENEIREIKGNYREFLELLHIWDRVEIINTPTTYREVVVPALGFRKEQYYSPKFLDVFDAVADHVVIDPAWVPMEKLFFSRSQLKKATPMEFGFEAVDDFFGQNGYAILYPEKVPLSQMIFYIRNAKVVASISGTPPHNMLFGRTGQTLQILERCALNNDYQVAINHLRQLHTTYIDANFPIYTVCMTGPFIMGYSRQLQRFAEDHGPMRPPQPRFLSDKYRKKCFANYMKSYGKLFGNTCFLEEYLLPTLDYHYEAYCDSLAYFGKYLDGSRPFFLRHYFQWHYWKQFVKWMLGKVGSR